MTSSIRCAGYFSSCLVTDRHMCRHGHSLEEMVAEAVAGGIQAVQVREKDLASGELLALAQRLRIMTSQHGVYLLMNDRVDVALASGADGVHLGRLSMSVQDAKQMAPRLIVGVSCHSVGEVIRAGQDGADYVFLGPIYDTSSKAAYGPPLGLTTLRDAVERVDKPVIAIGGITAPRVHDVLTAGASGVAVMGAILAGEHAHASDATHALMVAIRQFTAPRLAEAMRE